MSISDWPADQRPREKLIAHGAAALSDAELLAVFLRVGAAGKSAVDLSRELLRRFGSLTRLFGADAAALRAVRGMGEAKQAQLQAVPELARRVLSETLRAPARTSEREIRNYLRLTLADLAYESFHCLFLDGSAAMLASEELFCGTLTEARVYPREVVRRALHYNAAAVILAHNHPSGTAAPSQDDRRLTSDLVRALRLVDIDVFDHFIVAGTDVYSFVEHGLL